MMLVRLSRPLTEPEGRLADATRSAAAGHERHGRSSSFPVLHRYRTAAPTDAPEIVLKHSMSWQTLATAARKPK